MNHNAPQISRRKFLAAATATLAGPYILPSWAGRPAPSDRINLGLIGLGSRGHDHARAFKTLAEAQIVAACDVFRSKAESVQRLVGADCAVVQDFRELLARPDIDAVVIAAPENWHALMAIEAMRAGKDVYCEKALALTVAEGRAVCDTVHRYGRVFQAGTQQRSDARFRFACELARNGYLGKLHTITVGVPAGKPPPVLPVGPVPAELNYELWLGPAPWVPYREGLCSFNWYFVTDYCAGWIQSWGVHHVDIALWGAPTLHASTLAVEGTATFPQEGPADVSFAWQTKLTTPAGLTLNFCSDAESPHGHGCRFEGDNGWVHVDRGRLFAEPPSLLGVTLAPGEVHLERSKHHHLNFLECIRSRQDPVAPAAACHRATTLTLVADIATRLGRRLTWDWQQERFVNADDANRLLGRALRSPWHL